ncbi:MAG: hypothetical protein LBT71_08405 [Azoarcus sp.]|jgi:hypothetical protein|nr:hypothetical protein [Azoarcus sp.]
MNRRDDLLELTPNALAALANVGFVKRAQKDLAAGRAPVLDVAADGAVAAHFAEEGVLTRLPPGCTLRDAACNCTANGMCRHRVMLVLAYQAAFGETGEAGADGAPPGDALSSSFWSPAGFDDAALAASLAPSVLAQAEELAKPHPVIEVIAADGDAPPMARLPMASVVFYARHSLAHARCDCAQGGGCVHVALAVWAFRQAGMGNASDGARATVAVRSPKDECATGAMGPTQDERAGAFIARCGDLLFGLWQDGAAQPLLALDARLQALREQARVLDWRWVEDSFDELEQLLRALHARSTRFEPQRLLAAVAGLWARIEAAKHADKAEEAEASPLPAHHLLGLGVKGETPLDRLRLVSLGASLWADEADTEDAQEGADIVFADPDTQTAMVLQRQWPRAKPGDAATAVRARRVAGAPLHQLGAGQVLTAAAQRRANGVLNIGGTAKQTGVLPMSPTAWDQFSEPLRWRSIAELARHLATLPPDFVQPRHVAGAVRILAAETLIVRDVCWDAAAQVLHADLREAIAGENAESESASVLHLALAHRAATPHAVDALAGVLAGEWGVLRAVAGPVHLVAGVPWMQPLALLTGQRAVVPQLEAAPERPMALPQGFLIPAQGWRALLDDNLTWLTHRLRQGLRHQSGDFVRQIVERSANLDGAGLRRAAHLLSDAGEHWRRGEQNEALAALSKLTLLATELANPKEDIPYWRRQVAA